MQAGKITAKLRDAVPVCFFEGGEERARYKSIEIPDELKDLVITTCGFDESEDGRITFRLTFALGVLPEEFPPARVPISRADKRAARREAAALARSAEETSDLAEPPADNSVTTGASDNLPQNAEPLPKHA